MSTRTLRSTYAMLIAASVLAACSSSADSSDGGVVVTVNSTDDACVLSDTSAASGAITFDVTNGGSDTTEFYVYAADGAEVIGEVENIGPGLTRSLNVKLDAGTFVTACKPGMTGDGIRAEFTVS